MTVTTAERWMITAGIAVALLSSRAFVVMLLWLAGAQTGSPMEMLTGTMSIAMSLLLPLPLLMEVIQRSASWRRANRLVAHILCALLYAGLSGALSVAGAIVAAPAFPWDVDVVTDSFLWNIPGVIIVYSTSVAIVRALQWYRASMAAEGVRQELESREVSRTRRLLEQRYRPATIVSALRRIEGALPGDPLLADALLHRLARYARLLLRSSASPRPTLQSHLRGMRAALALRGIRTEVNIDRTATALECDGEELIGAIESAAVVAVPGSIALTGEPDARGPIVRVTSGGSGAVEFADALEQSRGITAVRLDEVTVALHSAQRQVSPLETTRAAVAEREPRSLSITLMFMVLGYGTAAVLFDLRAANVYTILLPMARILSLIAWLPAGVMIALAAARIARWRLRWAVPAAAAISAVAAMTVTAVVQITMAIMGVGTADPLKMLYDSYYILMRNLLVGQALMAMTFAHALARVLLATNREAARLRDDVALAESREIEARFHPHFLFNSLTLIASLIDTDSGAGAAVCRRLSDLVEKAVTSAGQERWTMRQELELASDYMAVQMMRFSDRTRIGAWEISGGAADAIIPRLTLQPLLENVFKHGVACNTELTAVGLLVRKRGKKMTITLWNDVTAIPDPIIPGRGLDFVRRRVAAAGGDIQFDRTQGRFVVRVKLGQT